MSWFPNIAEEVLVYVSRACLEGAARVWLDMGMVAEPTWTCALMLGSAPLPWDIASY